MAKHLLLWRLSNTRIPVDPKERGTGWQALLTMVKNDLEGGVVKDWGAFPGEGRGYAILEGTYLDIMRMTQQYNPYVVFRVHPVASILEVDDFIKELVE